MLWRLTLLLEGLKVLPQYILFELQGRDSFNLNIFPSLTMVGSSAVRFEESTLEYASLVSILAMGKRCFYCDVLVLVYLSFLIARAFDYC